jgi:DNA-binding transcriptional ArsR family regulator
MFFGYNTFMSMNVSPDDVEYIAKVFQLLSQPARIEILLIIAQEEACVCHIEAVLGIRQAVISQHLMLLRDARLVMSRRDGRNIFYHLANPGLIETVYKIASFSGIPGEDLDRYSHRPVSNCPCPHCNSSVGPSAT